MSGEEGRFMKLVAAFIIGKYCLNEYVLRFEFSRYHVVVRFPSASAHSQ